MEVTFGMHDLLGESSGGRGSVGSPHHGIMQRAWAIAVVLVAAAAPLSMATSARGSHDDENLWVTVAINAAGEDRIAVSDGTYDSMDSTNYLSLASEVAVAMGRPIGSFRAVRDSYGGDAVLDDKLAVPDGAGRLIYVLDTGQLQLLAERRSYKGVSILVCTPRVREVVAAQVRPQSVPSSRGNRCWGWYRSVEEPAIRASVQLSPDRHRYSSAIARIGGVAAIAFALLGIGATLLRRRMNRRSVGSWLLAVCSALGVTLFGWGLATFTLWSTGVPADSVLLGRGSVGEQVARTLLPGVAFVVPALLPAAILLTVAPGRKTR